MDDATPGRHPLHAPRRQHPFMPGAVAMAHATIEHVGDGFKTTVRVIRKTGNVILRIVAAEGIKHQERIEPALQLLRQQTGQTDARPIGSGVAGHQRLDTTTALERR